MSNKTNTQLLQILKKIDLVEKYLGREDIYRSQKELKLVRSKLKQLLIEK